MTLLADLVVRNAQVLTLDAARPRATAFAVRAGRVAAVGSEHDVEPLIGPRTLQLDVRGKTITPGFIDAHVHLLSYGLQTIRQYDLGGSTDIDDLLSRLADHATRTEGWIQGRGFDHLKMLEQRLPMREELDRISRHRPIFIARVCGHAAVANTAAIALLSESERLAGDERSGLYTEQSIHAFYERIPAPDETEAEDAVLAAARIALRTGITCVQTLLDTAQQMAVYARLRRRGKLPLRVVGLPPYSAVETLHAHGIDTTFGDEMLKFGAAKIFSDGSLGAQTALLSEPYADAPNVFGVRIFNATELKRLAGDAQRKGFQLAIHAIGDQAVRESIDAIEYALGADDNTFHRHRIEHVSMCAPDCLERMGRLKIVAVVQPQFVTSDTWTIERIGRERAKYTYNFKSLLRAGVPLALSSDCPVEKLDAFACLSAAVNRHPWSPEETLNIEEALRAYCLGSAYAAHCEDDLGSLSVGKWADFVVLSDDPTRVASNDLALLRVEAVYVAGRPVERAEQAHG